MDAKLEALGYTELCTSLNSSYQYVGTMTQIMPAVGMPAPCKYIDWYYDIAIYRYVANLSYRLINNQTQKAFYWMDTNFTMSIAKCERVHVSMIHTN